MEVPAFAASVWFAGNRGPRKELAGTADAGLVWMVLGVIFAPTGGPRKELAGTADAGLVQMVLDAIETDVWLCCTYVLSCLAEFKVSGPQVLD